MTNEEVNRIIAELSRDYDILRTGVIFRRSDEKEVKGTVLRSGHVQVCLKGKKYYVHRLVAMKYIKNPEQYKVVNHKDGNPANNNFYNLEWCDQKYNVHHHHKTNKRYKYNNAELRDIRKKYMSGKFTQYDLAEMYGTSQGYISQIINNKRHFNKMESINDR